MKSSEMRFLLTIALMASLSLVFTTMSYAQVQVYRTAEDLVNNTPVVNEHFEFSSQSGKYKDVVITIKHRKTKVKKELDCASIWGFSYNGKLFRVVKANQYYDKKYVNFPVLLSSSVDGGPHLWVVGNALVAQVHKGQKIIQLNPYYTSFVSATFTSDLVLAPIDDLGDGETKRIMAVTRKFVEDTPELEWFHTCMKEQTDAANERKKDVLRYHLVNECLQRQRSIR